MFQNILQNFSSVEAFQNLIIIVVVFLFSISVHEYAHGRWAYKLGDDTAQKQGRLTLNPISHLDPIGTLVLIVSRRIGWAKPVPINPVLFTRAKTMKRGIIEVSLAGPLSNFVLSFISYFLLNAVWLIYIITSADTGEMNFAVSMIISILNMMFRLNVFLGIFNLLPVPPLDGFKIFGSLLPDKLYYRFMELERYIGIIFIFVIIFAGGLFGAFLSMVSSPVFYIIQTPIDIIFRAITGLI